ncbi:NHX-9 protein [Aphelenchoides avenae]|nr:NHX-9 protein [Aphelenchus avenae]
MCSLLNRRRLQKFSAADQIVLCYGGLRGVIVFASEADVLYNYRRFGLLHGLRTDLLHIERMRDIQPTASDKLNGEVLDLAVSGVENIAGYSRERNILLK